MKKLLLLYCSLTIGLIYLIVPNTDPFNWFVFSDMELTLKTHLYFICEKVILIILAYVLLDQENKYRQALWVFFWLMVVDLVDYIASYNSIWFHAGGFPMSMNILKSIIFGLVIFREWMQRLK